MKAIQITFVLTAITVLLGFTSCSKCYECTRQIEVEVDKDGDGVFETEVRDDIDEVCTANKKEVNDKEDDGWSCS